MDLLKAPAYVYYDITNYLIVVKVISNIKRKNMYVGKIPRWKSYKGILEKRRHA